MTSAELLAYFKASPYIVKDDNGTRINVSPPTFIGPESERPIVWRALNRIDNSCQWHKAALAASVVCEQGARTDRGRGKTASQTFCDVTGIGPKYLRRMATAYTVVIAGLADPGVRKLVLTLLADGFFSFKHWVIATNHCARPFEALSHAKAQGWSANALQRALDGWVRHQICDDGTHVGPDDDDDDPLNCRPLLTRSWRIPLTKTQYRTFKHQLDTLCFVFGTTRPNETILRAVAAAYESEQQRARQPKKMVATA